jgi:hypothetical protein
LIILKIAPAVQELNLHWRGSFGLLIFIKEHLTWLILKQEHLLHFDPLLSDFNMLQLILTLSVQMQEVEGALCLLINSAYLLLLVINS